MSNIPLFKVFMAETAAKATTEVLNSGYIGQGKKVDEFENQLSRHLQTPYVNTVNSCTSGLHLLLHMLKSEGRDEVLTTPLTCVATNLPILANGLKIKWVDVDPHTCNIDMQDLKDKISPKTLAIMVVHWGGYPCDLAELEKIQDKCHGLYGFVPPIIEDCAHAFGAKYKNRFIGSHGNHCVFSFQAIKHLTTGDGGLITSPDEPTHQRVKLMRWYGLDRTSSVDYRCEQDITEWGFKFHMNDIAAAIGIENLKHMNLNLRKNQQNHEYLRQKLKDVVQCMEYADDRESACWIMTIRVKRRDDFIRKMKQNGIDVGRVHDRNDKHPCLKEFSSYLPNTNLVCDEMCCIPCGWWLMYRHLDYIIDIIKEGW
jgi:dTDP-4-amino-4,6-dideoxy-D-glucose/dTDP-4-amino-2,4-dideoxy-beta-L-xylose transaminase